MDERTSLAEHLADQHIAAAAGNSGTAEERVAAIRSAAEVIGALRPTHWPHHIDRVTHLLDAAPGSVHFEVIEAGVAWILDPTGQAAARLRTARTHSVSPRAQTLRRGQPNTGRTTVTPEHTGVSGRRWIELARSIDPRLPAGPDWAQLADALTRAHANGYHVNANLPRLAAAQTLPHTRPAAELYWRLLEDCQAAAPQTVRHAVSPASQEPAHLRHPSERPPSLGPDRSRPTGPDR